MRKIVHVSSLCMLIMAAMPILSKAQPDRWQQRIKYNINVTMDVVTNRFTGNEKLEYTNNSPDTLNRVFLHIGMHFSRAAAWMYAVSNWVKQG